MKTVRIALGISALSLAFSASAVPTPANYSLTAAATTVSGTSATGAADTFAGFNGGSSVGSNYGNVVSFGGTNGAQSVLVSAYGSTGAYISGGTTGYDRAIEAAYVAQYSPGLGITSQPTTNTAAPSASTGYVGLSNNNNELVTTNGGSTLTQCTNNSTACWDNSSGATPEHTIDNAGGYESLLLNFQTSVKLTSLTIGFPSSGSSIDSDATVLEYTPSTGTSCSATPTVLGLSYAQLVTKSAVVGSGCWTIAANLINLATSPNETQTFSTTSAAQYWMVGAYMDIGTNVATNPAISFGNDAIKVSALGINRVPEPGTIALFGIAGAALFGGCRRARKV